MKTSTDTRQPDIEQLYWFLELNRSEKATPMAAYRNGGEILEMCGTFP